MYTLTHATCRTEGERESRNKERAPGHKNQIKIPFGFQGIIQTIEGKTLRYLKVLWELEMCYHNKIQDYACKSTHEIQNKTQTEQMLSTFPGTKL